jgi:hypothetical protein
MDRESKQCVTCRRADQNESTVGKIAGRRAWHARSRSAPGLSYRARRRLLAKWRKQGRICAYCMGRCETVDHVLPLIKGGTNHIGNLVPCCLACNLSKADDLVIVWRVKRGDLANHVV